MVKDSKLIVDDINAKFDFNNDAAEDQTSGLRVKLQKKGSYRKERWTISICGYANTVK